MNKPRYRRRLRMLAIALMVVGFHGPVVATELCGPVVAELDSRQGLMQQYRFLENAVHRCPTSDTIRYRYANSLERLRRYEEASQEYEQAIRLNDQNGKYYFGLGDVYHILGKTSQALAAYEQGLQKEPNDFHARNRYLNLQKAAGQAAPRQEASLHPAPVRSGNQKDEVVMARLDSFLIDRRELSIGEFKAFFPEYEPPAGFSDEMPVINITAAQAEFVAQALDKRLCTATEWRRALEDDKGQCLTKANLHRDVQGLPYAAADSGEKTANGVVNLVGNVSEWVVDESGEPGFIGGHWYSAIALQDTMEEVTRVHRVAGRQVRKSFVGVRFCKPLAAPKTAVAQGAAGNGLVYANMRPANAGK